MPSRIRTSSSPTTTLTGVDTAQPYYGSPNSCRSGASGRSSFATNVRAPLRSTSAVVAAFGSVDVRTIRGRHGSAARTRARSTPLPSGRPMSTRAASGRSSCAAAIAVATVSASPTTIRPSPPRMHRASRRNSGSSSTSKTERATERSSHPRYPPRVGLALPLLSGRPNEMSGTTVWASRLARDTVRVMTARILEHPHFGRRSVAIAHRGRLVRAALRALLESEAGVVVLGEAGDGEAALAMTRHLRPDVVLVDESLPGLELVTGSSAAVIVVREDGDPAEVLRALRLGVCTHTEEENMLPPNVIELRRGSAHGTGVTRAKPRRRQASGPRLPRVPAAPPPGERGRRGNPPTPGPPRGRPRGAPSAARRA